MLKMFLRFFYKLKKTCFSCIFKSKFKHVFIHTLMFSIYRVSRKNTPTQKARYPSNARFFVGLLNFAHLFRRQLSKSVRLCTVFIWHMPNWRKRKLQKRILLLCRLYKRLIVLLR